MDMLFWVIGLIYGVGIISVLCIRRYNSKKYESSIEGSQSVSATKQEDGVKDVFGEPIWAVTFYPNGSGEDNSIQWKCNPTTDMEFRKRNPDEIYTRNRVIMPNLHDGSLKIIVPESRHSGKSKQEVKAIAVDMLVEQMGVYVGTSRATFVFVVDLTRSHICSELFGMTVEQFIGQYLN